MIIVQTTLIKRSECRKADRVGTHKLKPQKNGKDDA